MTDGNRQHGAGPLGRALRAVVGAWLVFEGVYGLSETSPTARAVAGGVALGALAFYAAVQMLASRWGGRMNPWLGAALAVVPVALVFIWGGPGGQLGVILFLGASLLVGAARADTGCEVMSLPGALVGRRTHLVCLLFSPVDWLEDRLTRLRQRFRST